MISLDASIERLILEGALEVTGIDGDTGEFFYTFTEKIHEVMPNLFKEHLNNVHAELMFFWEHGFINISHLEESSPSISLTKKAFDPDSISQLPKEKQRTLHVLKMSFGIL